MKYFPVLCACVLSVAATQAAAETWHFLTHAELINRSPGPDRLWQTGDDVDDLGGGFGANPQGAATVWSTSIFTGSLLDAFLYGGVNLAEPLPHGAGTVAQTSNAVSIDAPGIVEGLVGDALSPAPPSSTWTVGPGQTVSWDAYYLDPPAYRTVSSGFVFYPGDVPGVIMGGGAAADNVDYLMTLLPANWQAAVFFTGRFTDLAGVANGVGDFTGFAYTAVPVPAGIALLGAPLLLLRRRRSS
ncbi:MAG: hypothetical protein AB7Q81_06750 [Gammaproteobacteria bacterium]